MKTKYLSILFVVFATLGNAVSVLAQDFAPSYMKQALDTQRNTDRRTAGTKRTNAGTRRSNAYRTPKTVKSGTQTSKNLTTATVPKTALLAFGINEYSFEKNGLAPLGGGVNDVKMLDAAFDYADSTLLTDEKATYDAILNELERAARAQSERLIVYFGCHGVNIRGRSFVCPVDSVATVENKDRLNKLKDVNKVIEEGRKYRLIPLGDVLNVLKNASAKEVLVVFDLCRNIYVTPPNPDKYDDEGEGDSRGAGGRANENGDFMSELYELGKKNGSFKRANGGAFAVLTSCSVGQEAWEYFNRDYCDCGLFTRYWLEGITTGLADYAGLADGKISLVESYNYAYSKTTNLGMQPQTPERYLSNVSNDFILKVLDDPNPPENETDLQFLARTGKILANLKWEPGANKAGLKALDCVLENIPNDVVSRASRAAVRRKLGDYKGALEDYALIGEKFQLYATRNQNVQQDAEPADVQEKSEGALHEFDLLTVTKIENDRYFVSEVNNAPLKRGGWISAKNATWSLAINGSNITTATPTQYVRTTIPNENMISPGVNAVTGARPYVGTLGF